MAVFFTYDLTSFEITDVFPTQALANAEAARVPTKGAYAGSTDILDVQPDGNWYYFTEAPIVRPTPRIQLPVRRAFQTWHDRGIALSELLQHFGPIDWPQWALNLAHDSLHAWHLFGYVLYHWAAVPNADKLRALQMASLGPKDLDDEGNQIYDRDHPETIFPIMMAMREGTTDDDVIADIESIARRALPVVGIVIETGGAVTLTRRTLAEMYRDTSSTLTTQPVPNLATLDCCSYIRSINA